MITRISLSLVALSLTLACSEKSQFKGGVAKQSVEKAATDDATPAPEPAGKGPISDPTETDTIVDRCKSEKTELVEQTVNFPARKGCSWPLSGGKINNSYDGKLSDLETTEASLKFPSSGVLCEFSMESDVAPNFKYDDMLLFSLDDVVLFASTKELTPYFQEVSKNTFRWSKDKLVQAQRMNFDVNPYCLGEESKCTIPQTDMPGQIAVSISTDKLIPIVSSFQGKSSVPLRLSATGDNDESDCSHSDLTLKIKMKFTK